MGRIPARFPDRESALNLSTSASVATCDRLNLVSSLVSESDKESGEAGEEAPVENIPPAIPPDAAVTLSADESGFSYGDVRKAPGSGVTLKSGGW